MKLPLKLDGYCCPICMETGYSNSSFLLKSKKGYKCFKHGLLTERELRLQSIPVKFRINKKLKMIGKKLDELNNMLKILSIS